jgi:hypothetical protein
MFEYCFFCIPSLSHLINPILAAISIKRYYDDLWDFSDPNIIEEKKTTIFWFVCLDNSRNNNNNDDDERRQKVFEAKFVLYSSV